MAVPPSKQAVSNTPKKSWKIAGAVKGSNNNFAWQITEVE
jgi:hypothetical protein